MHTVALLRSVGQGMALVDMSLFLKGLGWNGSAIGAVLAGAGVARTIFTLFAAEMRARLGAKRCLLLFEALAACGALAVSVSANAFVLDAAIICSGWGSGHSGSGGPAFPVERGWLAAYARYDSHRLFRIHALFTYTGLGAGCLIACLASLCSANSPGLYGYRAVFLFIAILNAGCMYFIWRLSGGSRKASSSSARTASGDGDPSWNKENKESLWAAGSAVLAGWGLAVSLQAIGLQKASLYVPIVLFLAMAIVPNLSLWVKKKRLSQEAESLEEIKRLANLLNGAASALTGTMTSYWFSAKFAAFAGWIGAVMGVSYIAAGLWSLMAPKGKDKFETVRLIFVLQGLAVVFLLVLPWISSFWIAAVLEIGCTACSLGTRGDRTAVMMEDRVKGKRTLPSKIGYLLVRVGTVLWPGAFGKWIDEGRYAAPFYIVAAFQACSASLFAKVYRRPRPRERESG
ncbi:hypothetical protein [Cohnella laeviribosi]|uniref:hypothetical protein n=1 Tax=Cohnella laeviribosi TaxID=380174 RepID=UPI003D199092